MATPPLRTRRRKKYVRGPLGILALLLLFVIATPRVVSLLPEELPDIVVHPDESETDDFATNWNSLPLSPAEPSADKLPDSFE